MDSPLSGRVGCVGRICRTIEVEFCILLLLFRLMVLPRLLVVILLLLVPDPLILKVFGEGGSDMLPLSHVLLLQIHY